MIYIIVLLVCVGIVVEVANSTLATATYHYRRR